MGVTGPCVAPPFAGATRWSWAWLQTGTRTSVAWPAAVVVAAAVVGGGAPRCAAASILVLSVLGRSSTPTKSNKIKYYYVEAIFKGQFSQFTR